MAIRRILLPISADDEIAPLAETAFHLATLFKASVEGLFAGSRQLDFAVMDEGADLHIQHIVQQVQRATTSAERARAVHEAWAGRYAGVDFTFIEREGHHPEDEFVRRGWLADLTVIGTARQYDSRYWRDVREAALFRSGRPVVVTPGLEDTGAAFDKVLIAWKEGVEAARAVAAAQPFAARVREVHVVSIGEDEATAASLKELESYLRLHYAQVHAELLPPQHRPVGEVLLDKATSLGGALVVMGAYSHSRWRERVFGGVTEFILYESTSPVLLMH